MENLNNNTQGLLIRIDDIAENMNWKLMNKCEVLFDKHNIRPLIGVIPNNKDKELLTFERNNDFWDRVKKWEKKGWEISMHGFTHVYDSETKKMDYFNYGGRSEFFGHSFEEQTNRIQKGIEIFTKNNIEVKSFFAPNHTYDNNTFKALKKCGIKYIIDGYGFYPFTKNDLIFIPQLFYREIILPYGIQATQIHLNTWGEEDFRKFEKLLENNRNKFLDFNNVSKKIKNTIFDKSVNLSLKYALRFLRSLKGF